MNVSSPIALQLSERKHPFSRRTLLYLWCIEVIECFNPIVQAARNQPLHAKLAHVAERHRLAVYERRRRDPGRPQRHFRLAAGILAGEVSDNEQISV